MRAILTFLLGAMLWAFTSTAGAADTASDKTLSIYFIDVEGGQATLIVTPAKESLLIDTGFPGNDMRDAKRILAAARDAGLQQIDRLLITHFHLDHMGGASELASLIPIKTFIDHGELLPVVQKTPSTDVDVFKAYAAARSKGTHLQPKPGEKLALREAEAVIVSAATHTLSEPLSSAGSNNTACAAAPNAPSDNDENARSTGMLIKFGAFRFLDLGDLTGQPLYNLVCPKDLVGPVDVYLVAHHGGADSAQPATFAAFKPTVAILNNGFNKGGAPAIFELLRQVQATESVWQLHTSKSAGKTNFPDEYIANLDESTAHWLKLTASEDGSFQVLNARTGKSKRYNARR